MAVAAKPPGIPAAMAPPQEATTHRKTPVISIFAFMGVITLLFMAYVLTKWVTGPYFERVPRGPSQTSDLMHAGLIFWQVISLPTAAFLLYWFAYRPWKRERTIGVDGMIVIGGSFMWFQDPLSSATNHWFVYNSDMWNRGSWVNDIPWWTSFGEPGAMSQEPMLFTPGAYVYVFLLGAFLGCFAMRQAKKRFPNITGGGLVAICFVSMCVFDMVLEGLIWLPMGVFEYPGGHWALWAGDTYHKYPLNETVTVGAVFTCIACLRYFVNDKGQTIIERGSENLKGGGGKKIAYRALAFIAFMQLAYFTFYNVPNSWIGANSATWPKDLQERSYFTNGMCGGDTNRPCPGPGVVNIRDGAPYVGADGRVMNFEGGKSDPAAKDLPRIYPYDRGKPGGDE